jgi:Coenzyme PQQ synthesis protein D (PqqD)
MSLSNTLSSSSLIVATQHQVSSDLAGEAVILDMSSGTYYGLNAVGASVWQLIQAPKTVNQVQDALLEEYEVDATTCEGHLLALLNDLQDKGLIEVVHG